MLGEEGPTPQSARRYSPHQDAAKHSALPKTLGPELTEHYQAPQDLPHQIFALLVRLNDRVNGRRRGSGPS